MKIKERLTDLAIFGGTITFTKKLHVGCPNIGSRKKLFTRLSNILENKWLTNDGPYVREFEHKLAKLLGVTHCVATCNATIGLGILIKALGLSGEVILPAFTFVATAHTLQWLGLTPVFCDIHPQTWNIDPAKIEELITTRTCAILGVHLFGRPCDVSFIAELARNHNLKIIYDAAHALNCSVNGKMVGNFGQAEVFSFHATKFINSLEGGVIATNDDELAEKLRLMRNFGFKGYDNVVSLGINAKMNEFAAAMGLTSLEKLKSFFKINKQNYQQYRKELNNLDGVALMKYPEKEQCNFQYIVLQIDEEKTGISRDELTKVLWGENILARRYFYPGCHRMQPYVALYPEAGQHLPQTERVAQQLLCLPTGTSLGKNEVNKICRIIKFCVAHGREISRKFSKE